MLGQRAALVELRPADRHAAADGGTAIEHGLRAQVQPLDAIGRDPGQQVTAMQRHGAAGAVGRGQAEGGLAAEVDR
jgi:hypothetical protein